MKNIIRILLFLFGVILVFVVKAVLLEFTNIEANTIYFKTLNLIIFIIIWIIVAYPFYKKWLS